MIAKSGAAVLLVTVASGVLGYFIDDVELRNASSDLVQFFGILAGFVVNAMLITATILSPRRMRRDRLVRISNLLGELQRQTAVTFGACVAAALFPVLYQFKVVIDLAGSYLGAVTLAAVAFALSRTVLAVIGILELHRLRHDLLIEEAGDITPQAPLRPVPPANPEPPVRRVAIGR